MAKTNYREVRVYLTTYNRPTMLKATLKHLGGFGIKPIIYEDGVTHPYRGKKGYWQTWDEILKDAQSNPSELYLFMPDDFQDIDIEKIKQLHDKFKSKPYVYNIINDGRHESWRIFQRKQPKNGTEEIGFCDCGFFCNYEALTKTKWHIKQPPVTRWKQPAISSGVGMQLTHAFFNGKVKMYKPTVSLATHGDHESVMHPTERKKTPLKSK